MTNKAEEEPKITEGTYSKRRNPRRRRKSKYRNSKTKNN